MNPKGRTEAMALEVRRIVTGHDSQGKAVVATDERLAGTGAAGRAGISRVDVWSTDKMPIDNSDPAAELQRKGFVVRHNYVGSGRSQRLRLIDRQSKNMMSGRCACPQFTYDGLT
jgi:hypothetical protein